MLTPETYQSYKNSMENYVYDESEKIPTVGEMLKSLTHRPRPYQLAEIKLMLEYMRETFKNNLNMRHYKIVIVGANSVGKSVLACQLLYTALYEAYVVNRLRFTGTLMAGLWPQVMGVIYTKMLGMYEDSPILQRFFHLDREKITPKVSRSSMLQFLSGEVRKSKLDSLQGKHEPFTVSWLEELPGISTDVMRSVDSYHSENNGLAIRTLNPDYEGSVGDTMRYAPDVHRYVVIDRPSIFGDNDPYAKKIAFDYGIESPEYQSRVLGLFPALSSIRTYTRYDIDVAIDRGTCMEFKTPQMPVIIGVDVSKGIGRCAQAVTVRDLMAVWDQWIKPHLPLCQLPYFVAEIAVMYNTASIVVDTIGCGEGVPHAIRQALLKTGKVTSGIRIIESKNSHKSDNYIDKRSELHARGSLWLRDQGALAPGDYITELIEQMSRVTKDTKQKTYAVNKKDHNVPNDAIDSYALTFDDPMYDLVARQYLLSKISGRKNVCI